MKVNVKYSDYLTDDGRKKIESYETVLSEGKILTFEIMRPSTDVELTPTEDGTGVELIPLQDSPHCKMTLEDTTTLEKIECVIPQKEYRDFMQIVKEISTQFNV